MEKLSSKMTHNVINLTNLRKQAVILSKDVDDCQMNNLFTKRLQYQQLKGMCMSNYFKNSPFAVEPAQPIANNSEKAYESKTTNDIPMDIDMENEGENVFSLNGSPTETQLPSLERAIHEKSKSECDISIALESYLNTDSSPDVSILTNTSPSQKFNNSISNCMSDRYIPARSGKGWQTRFSMLPDSKEGCNENERYTDNCNNPLVHKGNREASIAYSSLLRNELLDTHIEGSETTSDEKRPHPVHDNISLFQYGLLKEQKLNIESTVPYSLSPLGHNSQKLLRSPRKTTRKISRIPFKVLDAPELQDDFYLNLVDWSSQNVLSVGLGSCVYLWSACTGQVTRLCDLSTDGNSVTSVSWNSRGDVVAVGTHNGLVQIWDVVANKVVTKLFGHSARVGALAWNGDLLASGSRDRTILLRDARSSSTSVDRKLPGHRQEVCGLKWSPDDQHLASGGNDNRLHVWNMHSLSPVQTYTDHLAAVKGIAWSPHHHGLLASGGGTADRCIRFWNTLTGQPMQCVDTGSQVCNLVWSKHSSELVSTHGYSQNQILVWKYPTLTQVAKLTGHSYRVLYLAMSPDGESIVTGAGDETLRFWNVFSKVRSRRENKSVLNLFGNIR